MFISSSEKKLCVTADISHHSCVQVESYIPYIPHCVSVSTSRYIHLSVDDSELIIVFIFLICTLCHVVYKIHVYVYYINIFKLDIYVYHQSSFIIINELTYYYYKSPVYLTIFPVNKYG